MGTNARVGYEAWLRYEAMEEGDLREAYGQRCSSIMASGSSKVLSTAARELAIAVRSLTGRTPVIASAPDQRGAGIVIGVRGKLDPETERAVASDLDGLGDEGYVLRTLPGGAGETGRIAIVGGTEAGALYGVFHFIRLMQTREPIDNLHLVEQPANGLRMINQWDNMDGSIERGYAGKSIFYRNDGFVEDFARIRDYARLLASTGINAISINNVNVHREETKLITPEYQQTLSEAAEVFGAYGIKLYLSINFASPIAVGGLATADPLEPSVREWWAERAADLYRSIPDFGGFLVKADSEFRPGPFTYGRDHADGANMLAEALEPHGGVVIWRCFVYNCLQDWRDRSTDRAKAAYDHFMPLDGRFADNVILQIKNGPMDFQVREPVSPLFGGLSKTNQMLELQITQEYTGQQKHVCYLVPLWKEVLDFDTHAAGKGSTVAKIASGALHNRPFGGIAAVSNIGDDDCWTGHPLAQANLYGYGRLTWNPSLPVDRITRDWIRQSLGCDPQVEQAVTDILHRSWGIYESYTSPLGVGWMVNPNHHYGPNVDGYEYSKWGTYHFADRSGIGVDRTIGTGTGYAGQYHQPWRETYNSEELCPDELLLFFHHVPYTHILKSGKTVIQHIYDTHFEGAEEAAELLGAWRTLEGKVEEGYFALVSSRLAEQREHAKEWRDVINTYFYRKSGIADRQGRLIY
ncbi:alpha-glucuronidase family glycosyl hydrolase [Paenibacillus sp. LHD-117]|uniref:alpha-glucuronidase family glycosyl hydrolase n=1 Tax=Paenibacillus sp. LHD-117 TaxID=3071412 RepID=UPI0027DFE49C|nr:alpha-glucuronidase family glycosyl hydrolase [Paenibacillus sp. LHD-117]MDQ6419562.1 alpha-glucuronidase family glycosyl hydrolase [Paenibacillus sp. LHD-117]